MTDISDSDRAPFDELGPDQVLDAVEAAGESFSV